jgi:hypothetical protein
MTTTPEKVDPEFEKQFRQCQRWGKVCEHLGQVKMLLQTMQRAEVEGESKQALDIYLMHVDHLLNGHGSIIGASAEWDALMEGLETQAHDEEAKC